MTGTVSRDRRRFLTAGAAALGAAATSQLWLPGTARAAEPQLPDRVFTLGVASGDPLPDAVVLWTRLAPDPLNGGGMPDRAVPVQWEIAEDSRFRKPVRRGLAQALPEYGHSVHVDVRGLRPGRAYWYRFRVDGQLTDRPHPHRPAPPELGRPAARRARLLPELAERLLHPVRRHARPGPRLRALRR